MLERFDAVITQARGILTSDDPAVRLRVTLGGLGIVAAGFLPGILLFGRADIALTWALLLILEGACWGLLRTRYADAVPYVMAAGASLLAGAALFMARTDPQIWAALIPAWVPFAIGMGRLFGRVAALIWGVGAAVFCIVTGLASGGALAAGLSVTWAIFGAGLHAVLFLRPYGSAPTAVSRPSAKVSADSPVAVNDDHVGQLLDQLAQTARDLNRASSAIHNVTTQHAQGAEQQANVITEATMILDEFRTLADQSREQARILSALAQETQTISSTGHESVSMAIEEMQEIERQVTVIASRILALAENTQRIGNIMATVSDIATQSNFLALNASIQAARAGTQGEGFAIVAQEVRDLAQQSKVAASEVRAILREIQNAMKHTITATESGAEEAQRGVDLADKAREVILKLSENITRSTDTSQEILSAVEQQTGGMEQVVASMQDLNRVTMQNLASTRMAEAVAQNLSRLSGELSETLEKFEGNHHES